MATQDITAIRWREKRVDRTTLRTKKKEFEVREHEECELELEDAVDPSSPEFSAALKHACGKIEGMVGLSLSTDVVLLRVVELPSADPDELAGMVELQVDKFSPFPADQMAVAFEVLAAREAMSRVLIAAVRKEHVDTLVTTFDKIGLLPHWIDIDILGWWELLREANAIPEAGRHAFVIVDERGAELVVTQSGIPVLFRSLGGHAGLMTEHEVSEIVEEVAYTLTTLETEWGAAERQSLSLWTLGEPAPLLVARLDSECGAAVESRRLDELPPLSEGLARRFAMPQGSTLNLVPRAWHDEEHSRKVRKVLITVSVLFLAIWASGVTVFFVMLNLQKSRWAGLQSRAQALEASAAEVRALQEKVRSLERYADRSQSSLECLREVSTLLPAGVDLTSFSYRKGRSVNLRGEAPSEGPIYDFIAGLEKSSLFTEVKTEGISSKRIRGQIRTEFKVTLVLPGEEES